MKSNLLYSCWGGLFAGAMLLVASPDPAARAQNTNLLTTNAWDCLESGQRQGTALFQFNTDGTFDITEIMVPNAPANSSSSSSTGRGGTGTGRSGSGGGSTNVFVPNEQIFGDEEVTNGLWAFNPEGHVIGFFVETSFQENCKVTPIPISTNPAAASSIPLISTNPPSTDPIFCVTSPIATNIVGGVTNYENDTVCYTNAIVCTANSNAISFVGTVSSKRLILKCTTSFGNTTYEGVPLQALPDISGQYSGVRKQAGVTYQEFLTLTNQGANTYGVSLNGPGYTYTGFSMLSSQKKIAFSLGLVPSVPTNQVTVVRAVVGPFNGKKGSANTRGWDQPAGTFANPETFNIQVLP